RELEHLARDRALEAVDQRHAVLDLQHRADVVDVERTKVRRLDFLEEDLLQLAGPQHRIRRHGAQSLRVKNAFPEQLVKIVTRTASGQAGAIATPTRSR